MTELLIDKQRVVLPSSLSMQVIEENPFFTKNGTYTLDITLSLEEDENAKVYHHIDRINVIDNIGVDIETGKPQNRSALLIVDNEVVLNGTEIITNISNNSVTIQLVSGNSELNFLIGGDRKLRDLDLGKADINPDSIIDDLTHPYPERNWLLIPFYAENFSNEDSTPGSYVIGNSIALRMSQRDPIEYWLEYQFNGQYDFFGQANFKNYRPQPYLCFIIRRIIEELGYELEYNALAEHEVLRYIYIVHGVDTLWFAKMLPEWTVNEFLTKIETQFDCVFIVDAYTKGIRLMFNYQADSEGFGKETLTILDNYTIELDRENTITVRNGNVGYNLDDHTYYNYQNIDKYNQYVENRIILEEEYGTLNNLLNLINNTSDPLLKRKVFTGQEGSFVYDTWRGFEEINWPRKTNGLQPLYQNKNNDSLDIEFDLIPAPMFITKTNFGVGTPTDQMKSLYPVVQNADPFIKSIDSETDTSNITIEDIVEGGYKEDEKNVLPTKMYVAMYSGLQRVPKDTSGIPAETAMYPYAWTEALADFFHSIRTRIYFDYRGANPFNLEWMKENIYSLAENIDTTKTYKLTFTDPGKIDIMSKFIANNKAFRCAKIERTITIDGFAETVKGDFYPYNTINN